MTTQVKDNLTVIDTVEKWQKDGLTKEEAIEKWEAITHTTLPENIKCLIPQEVR